LLTRVGPNERAVPKPAFELTEKKLEPRTTKTVTKKGTITKRKKVVAKNVRTVVAVKKPTPTPANRQVSATAQPPSSKKPSGGQKPSAAIAKGQANPAP